MAKREINVDLLRIIATVFAIVLHILGQGGILQAAPEGSGVYWTAWLVEIGAYCAVNCFALISGYVMVDRSVKLKNLLNLWAQILFYSVLITALFFVFAPQTRTVRNLVKAFLPIVSKQWWYMSSYFALFFFMPLLNAAIQNMSRQTYQRLLLVILVGVCGLECVAQAEAFALNNGYSPFWLMIVYLFGAYIKKYDTKDQTTATKSLLGFLGMVALTFASKFVIYHMNKGTTSEGIYDDVLISYTSITILLAAVFLFLFCLRIRIGNGAAKWIELLSPAALGVYLIHVHPLVFDLVIRDAFIAFAGKGAGMMLVQMLAATLVMFVLCAAIELARLQLFKWLRVSERCKGIADNFLEHTLV